MKKVKNLVQFWFILLIFYAEAVVWVVMVGGVFGCMFSWKCYCKPTHSL